MKSIHVSIRNQRLTLKEDETPIRSYPVSTSRFGIGTEEGSMKTPTGRFSVAKKIGGDMPSGTICQSRMPLKPSDPLPPTEDLVTSRILWLDGLDDRMPIRATASSTSMAPNMNTRSARQTAAVVSEC